MSALRNLIVNNDPDYFRGTSVRSLDLWKVNIPVADDEAPQNPDLSNTIKLRAVDKIAKHFDGPLEQEQIHITIRLTGK